MTMLVERDDVGLGVQRPGLRLLQEHRQEHAEIDDGVLGKEDGEDQDGDEGGEDRGFPRMGSLPFSIVSRIFFSVASSVLLSLSASSDMVGSDDQTSRRSAFWLAGKLERALARHADRGRGDGLARLRRCRPARRRRLPGQARIRSCAASARRSTTAPLRPVSGDAPRSASVTSSVDSPSNSSDARLLA